MPSPPPPESLVTLPEEVLERVVLYLSPRDVANATRTCRKLSALVDASSAIQYNVALQQRGYVDIPVRREALVAARARELEASAPLTPMSGIESNSGAHAALNAEASEKLAEHVEEARRENSRRSQDMTDGQLMQLMLLARERRGAGPSGAAGGSSSGSLFPTDRGDKPVHSPHTGLPRATLPTVSLAPWPEVPPKTRKDYSYLSTAGKNKALRARERRWDTVTPAQVRRLSVRGPSGVYELQEGILLMCEEPSLHEKPYTIRLIPLPSVNDPDLDDPSLPVKSHTVPFAIADLTMDPTQDLIVVSEHDPVASQPHLDAPAHRYHLLSLSTFEPHPLAALPTLDFPPTVVQSNWPRQLIQIMGDTLVAHISREGINIIGFQDTHAVVAQDSEEEIVAWNWKTGEVLGRIHLGRTNASCTFCMLSPTLIAVARSTVIRQRWDPEDPDPAPIEELSPPAIVILSFAQEANPPKVDQPLMANSEDATTPRAVEVARLLMPALAGDLTELSLENFHMRPDPAYPAVPGGQATLGKGKPFTQDPSRGLMVLEVWVAQDMENTTTNFEMFILRETLLKFATDAEDTLRASRASGDEFAVKDLAWAEWGEENTRFMPQVQNERRRWVCSCSGYRMASLVSHTSSFGGEPWTRPEVEDPDEPLAEPSHRVQLVVHDFNPAVIAKDRVERARRGIAADASTPSWIVPATPDEDDDNHAASSLADEYTVTLWDTPTVLPKGDIWAEDIVTRLPFRTVRRGLVGFPNGVMIDDQRILTVFTSKAENHTWRDQRQDITVLCM